MSAEQDLLVSDQGRVRVLLLNRPGKRNALSRVLRTAIVDALSEAEDDSDVGAVVLSGSGGHFCAGFDLVELAEAPDRAALFADAERYHQAVHTFAKPIVAAIEGTAVAGGLDLALMCDLRIAGTNASLGQPQVRHGIPASYELMASVISDPDARDLCLTGRVIDAEEALRIGLVGQVLEPDRVHRTAVELAADIASHSSAAATKARIISRQPRLFGSD